MRNALPLICLSGLYLALFSPQAGGEDQPQWGQRLTRNMVSAETGLPETFDPGKKDYSTDQIDLATTGNVKWVAQLGRVTYGSPIVAGGRVFVGTNNDIPRDERIVGDRGILMCFDEKTGEFLWQLNVPKLVKIKWADWRYIGLTSPPTVEGSRAYLVSNRCEVMCLDVVGMANGNDGPYQDEGRLLTADGQPALTATKKDADIVWLYDMTDEMGTRPHNGSNCSVLLDGDLLYVCTGNGVDWTHNQVANPEAPSVLVLNKHTGRPVAKDDFGIGADIVHGQWTSLSLGQVGQTRHVYFGAGNGYLYAFGALGPTTRGGDLRLLEDVWKFNGHPLAQTQDVVPLEHCHDTHSYEVVGMPVFYQDRVYAVFTQEAFHNMKEGWLMCLDATHKGDVTRSGIVWSYDKISSSISTVSIADGLLYLADFSGRVHCLDAETGKPCWVHNAGPPIWGSTLVADGKVYFGTGRADFWVLKAGKDLEVLSEIRMRDQIFTTPTAAGGVLYVATNRHLYAIAKGAAQADE